jgi:hypothetical protein
MAGEIMPLIAPSGNSEGSTYLGIDGKAYRVINGRDIEVSRDKLIVAGFKPLPDAITIDGIIYNRNRFGVITLSENGRLIASTEAEIQKVSVERFGGQLEARLQQEANRMQMSGQNLTYFAIGGSLLLLLWLLRD